MKHIDFRFNVAYAFFFLSLLVASLTKCKHIWVKEILIKRECKCRPVTAADITASFYETVFIPAAFEELTQKVNKETDKAIKRHFTDKE